MDIAGGDGADPEVGCEILEGGVAPHVRTLERTLQLDEEALATERRGEPGGSVRIVQGEPVTGAAREADEPLGMLLEEALVDGWRERLPVLSTGPAGSRMGLGQDPAEVRVSPARLDEQRHVEALKARARALALALVRLCRGLAGERQLGSRNGAYAEVLCGVGELERAVDAVVVGEGERRIPELGGAGGQLLGQRGAVEERVRRVAVELDVRHVLW